ncbi:sigma-70 family RNA polymerase sigma factor [Bacillus nitratireducens]|uniref:sigma-70 family RNA polymerase sigma factor n=1 Tax=Bacillus nitratireducens TaxID=2026193 RepID=UPI003D302EAF
MTVALVKKAESTKIQRVQETKRRRIIRYRHCNRIFELEKQWEVYAKRTYGIESGEPFEAFYQTSHSLIDNLARIQAATIFKKFGKSTRISYSDLYSIAQERAWEAVEEYSWISEYYLYEHIKKAIKSVIIDYLRAEGLVSDSPVGKNFFHIAKSVEANLEDVEEGEAVPLKLGSVEFEKDLTTKLFLEEVLTGEELEVAKLYIIEGVKTLDEIGGMRDIKYRSQVKRFLDSGIKKLATAWAA